MLCNKCCGLLLTTVDVGDAMLYYHQAVDTVLQPFDPVGDHISLL